MLICKDNQDDSSCFRNVLTDDNYFEMGDNELIKQEGSLIKRVGNDIKITNKLLGPTSRKIHVVHFDDHRLFLDSVQAALDKLTSDFTIKSFTDGEDALNYIESSFRNNYEIDVIITGMNQPKFDGFAFSQAIRDVERKYNLNTPIILLSMVAGIPERLQQHLARGFEAGLWSIAIGKNVSGQELYQAIMSVLDKT